MTSTNGKLEPVLARILHWGAWASFLLCLLGTALFLFGSHDQSMAAIKIGILALLLTPLVRIVAALAMFIRNRELRYVAISTGVLLIVLTSLMLGTKLD